MKFSSVVRSHIAPIALLAGLMGQRTIAVATKEVAVLSRPVRSPRHTPKTALLFANGNVVPLTLGGGVF